MRTLPVLGALTCLALLAAATGVRADAGVPARYRPVVQQALHWLVAQQNKRTGHWEAEGQRFPIAMTAFAGMALLGEGSTVREGKYARNIRLARDFLLSKAQPNGMIGDPNLPGEAGRYMYGHGFALLFLSSVYGEEEDANQRRKLERVLVRAVKFTRDAQTSRGGWGYVPAREGSNFDEGSVTITQFQALRAARNAGIKVPPEAIKMANKYLQDATGPDGGVIYSLAYGAAGGSGRPPLTAAAIACSFSAGDANAALIRQWFKFCQRQVPRLSSSRLGYDEYTHYYHGQALYLLGDDGYAKLFPGSKEADRLSWTKYRAHTFDFLKQTQSAEGCWTSGQVGPVFATSVYLTILQLDNTVLPIYQR